MEESAVVVSESVAAKLAGHLHEQGRLRGGVPMVIASLNKAVERKWGVATDHFSDSSGPGWIIDVSDYFEDELLYAVVRSDGGNRSVVAVVDEDEIGTFKKTGHWATPEAGDIGLSEAVDGLTDPQPQAAQQRAVQRPPFVPVPVVQPQPDEPRLVLWWESDGDEDDTRGASTIEVKYSETQRTVMPLLMRGCKVEVWMGVKRPELKVDL